MEKYTEYWKQICRLNEKILPLEYEISQLKKEMRENYDTVIGIGYCNAHYLLKFEKEIAYSCGAGSWSCDYYEAGNVLISTGYSPLNSRNAKPTYEIIKKYNDEAMKISHDYSIPWETQKEIVSKFLHNFIEEVAK